MSQIKLICRKSLGKPRVLGRQKVAMVDALMKEGS